MASINRSLHLHRTAAAASFNALLLQLMRRAAMLAYGQPTGIICISISRSVTIKRPLLM